MNIVTSMCAFLVLCSISLLAQENGPWNAPLMWAEETAPDVFSAPRIFQDSSGVPCVVRKGASDTLLCAFQWFREPRNAPTWDRVAVKVSTDDGVTWTQPVPIVIDGIPAGYQRPFDPTLVSFRDSIRIYFSSSVRMPMGGLDSLVNTYSAVGTDGIHFRFEPGARFDHATRPVIDPAVIHLNNTWLFVAPIGAPQEGAYQAISNDGLVFSELQNIPSDNQHNWTGNLMYDEDGTLQFYGSGPMMWRVAYIGFGSWGNFRSIGVQGGDPSAVARKESGRGRWIVFVGPRYTTSIRNDGNDNNDVMTLYPNPCVDVCHLPAKFTNEAVIFCTDIIGQTWTYKVIGGTVDLSALSVGTWMVHTEDWTVIGIIAHK
ncbi:MAG: sialidase family protein [Candidatus Kapabacteria bacterium]|nr:sialidase family protein [Candidatus Kapabacteria bacterium]